MTEALTGWGRTAPTRATVHRPSTTAALSALVDEAGDRGLIARGLGRSYGDAAQNAGGDVALTTGIDGIGPIGPDGQVRVEAGVSIDDLLRVSVPRGWFVPVSPGTRYVTAGGAFAADIHGKNHHRVGSWCDHVTELELTTPAGGPVTVSADDDPDLFWATAGGMGLTGAVTAMTVRLTPITRSRLLVDTDRTGDLDETLELMATGDDDYGYSVAWIDTLARGARMGRSVLTRGDFDTAAGGDDDPLAYDPSVRLAAPPWAPSGLLNRWSVRAFNEAWYRKAPARARAEPQSIPAFFHPLDGVRNWNRVYGSRGFLQWQSVLPFGEEACLARIVEAFSLAGHPCFLAVLKRFGPGNAGPLSFPMAGWTLALDVPAGRPGLGALLDDLDEQVAAAGGRIYLAKDSRLRPEHLEVMYPRLDQFRAVRARVDPDGRLESDLGRRLGLC